MRAAACGLVALLSSLTSVGQAQERAPNHLVLDELFVNDSSWASLTVEGDAEVTTGESGAAIRGEATIAASATAEAPMRGSLDVDLVTSIVADRAQRVTMRAVADAIDEVEGVAAGRRYVRELVIAATDVLLDRGGLQRANVEHLVSTVVRLVMAEIVVRMRFPNANMLDRASYWERRLCSQGAGHRRPSAEGLRHCNRLRMGWPDESVDEARTRLYLVDLAYWRLGATGLFGEEAHEEPPSCPFPLGTRGGVLCQVLTAGATDDERDRRVDWVLDIPRFEAAISVARALYDRWDPRGSGLRGFLRAVVRSRDVGGFGETPGLGSFDWDAARRLIDASIAMRGAIAELFAAADDAARTNGSETSIARFEAAAVALRARCDVSPATCADQGVDAWLTSEIALWEDEQGSPQASAARPGGVRAEGAGGPRAVDRQARAGKVPQIPEPIRVRLGALLRELDALDRRLRLAWQLPDDADGLADARARVERASGSLSVRVARLGNGAFLPLASLSIDELPPLEARTGALAATLQIVRDAFAAVPPTEYVAQPRDFVRLELSIRSLTATARLLDLFGSLNLHSAREAGVATLGSALHSLEALAVEHADGALLTPVLDLLGDVMFAIERGRALDTGQLFALAAGIDEADVLRALGEDERAATSCELDEGSLACWTVRIVLSLREAMVVGEGRIAIDGAMFRSTLATLGEDFRARTEWRPYFHLAVGLGQLGTFAAAPGSDPGTPDRFRIHAIVAEQIGFGLASPSFAGDNLTFRTSLFLSGLLYRAVFDNEESDALILGIVAAVDVYELLQLYVAPTLLFFPGSDDSTAEILPGIAIGAQVPLGDYLSQL